MNAPLETDHALRGVTCPPGPWRIRRLSLFLIIVLSAAGLFSYLKLGRAEDPRSPSRPW